MESLKQNIIKNYVSDVKKFINDVLLKKGFIKSDNGLILKFDVFNDDFKAIEFDDVSGIVDDHVDDLWNIPPEIKNDVIYDNLMESLSFATESEIHSYKVYSKTEKAMIDDKRLKADVKALFKANKTNHKKVFQGGINSPEFQSQALINNDVIYDDSIQAYFIFDKDNDMFKKLSLSDVMNILNKEFNGFDKSGNDAICITDYMNAHYFMFIMNSGLPHIYNRNKANKDIFIDLKDDYLKVKKIISGFK